VTVVTETEFYTIEEVSVVLRKSVPTLRRWRTEGFGPPSYKIGGSLRYDRQAVESWVQEQKR
jgi:excisionase family DNA binding protein